MEEITNKATNILPKLGIFSWSISLKFFISRRSALQVIRYKVKSTPKFVAESLEFKLVYKLVYKPSQGIPKCQTPRNLSNQNDNLKKEKVLFCSSLLLHTIRLSH